MDATYSKSPSPVRATRCKAILVAGYLATACSNSPSFSPSFSIIAIFVLTVTFLYHQVLYYLIIQREKNRILDKLAKTIIEAYGNESTEEILSKIKLYKTIEETKDTALHANVIIPYAAGVAAQLIPLVATNPQFEPILRILQSLPK